jgi:hypothetical protein
VSNVKRFRGILETTEGKPNSGGYWFQMRPHCHGKAFASPASFTVQHAKKSLAKGQLDFLLHNRIYMDCGWLRHVQHFSRLRRGHFRTGHVLKQNHGIHWYTGNHLNVLILTPVSLWYNIYIYIVKSQCFFARYPIILPTLSLDAPGTGFLQQLVKGAIL